jgi:acyl-coenzyme A thioesterase PaaI-like protein
VSDGLGSDLERADLASGLMPPHHRMCFGCGPDSPQGFHLQVHRDGDEMVTEHVFEERHSSVPGIAHGGSVATVVDDVLGFLLYVAQVPGVTRTLEVEYLKPTRTGVAYVVRSRLDDRDGRKLWVSCTGTDPEGAVAFRGKALFLAVDRSHFERIQPAGTTVAAAPVAP